MITEAWTQFKYHPVQQALWQCPKRFVAVPAGRGSGKTELAKRRLVRFLPVTKEWQDPRYFYGAPTRNQAKRIAWDHLKALVPADWVAHINESALVIKTRFGSELHVVGLDKPQRIEGIQWDGCVLDESCDLRPKTFDLNVLPTLVWRRGWCWRIGVPKRQGWGAGEFRTFFERAQKGDEPEAAAFTWPSADIVPADILAYHREHMDGKDFNEQFNAQWETVGGGVFHAYDREYNVRPCSYRADRAIVVGSDFNVDPMSWVLAHRWPDRLEVFDEIFRRDTNTQKTLDYLWSRYREHQAGFEFYGDATGRSRHASASSSDYKIIINDERFQTAGRTVHYPRGNPDRSDRFAATNAFFCNAAERRRLFIDERCKHLIQDCEQRAYRAGTREPADGGDVGHMTDALGYVVHYVWPIKVRVEQSMEISIRSS